MATANPLAPTDRTQAQRAAPRRGPRVEPDRSVWRLLCFAGAVSVSDEQLLAAFPAFSLEALGAARARVAPDVDAEGHRSEALTVEDLAEAATVTMQEVLAAGLDPHHGGWAGLTIRSREEHVAFFAAECDATS
jgi:hypothetical protein